ncbi:MAG: adenylate/guanylate cyclase domain-containing protein [Alphaproteobacteria bacterium]
MTGKVGATISNVEPACILIVDDIETNRALLQRHMEREGHTVTLAADGQIALDLLENEPFDLVLLDLMMPGINGLEVLRRTKDRPETARLPVVMISALDELHSVVRCLEDGAEDYLTKPFDPVLLHARVNAILERAQLRAREQRILSELTEEKKRSDRLLRSILPEPIVERMSAGEAGIADRFDTVTVLFCDIVGFTEISSAMTPGMLVANLDKLFRRFDELAVQHGIEKIKTIGDAYMAVAGLPVPRTDHAQAAAAMARDMIEVLDDFGNGFGRSLAVRIGLHSGPVTAGVIGAHRFIYDVWGDTVNVASRLETLGVPNRIHLSAETARLLDGTAEPECRGTFDVKGKGRMTTYIL